MNSHRKISRFSFLSLASGLILTGCVQESITPVPLAFEDDNANSADGDGSSSTDADSDGNSDSDGGDTDADSDADGDADSDGGGNDADTDADGDGAPSNGYDGDPCLQDSDCLSGTCLQEPDWPGGYCTTIDCDTRVDCVSETDENACLQNPQASNFCIRLCDPSVPSDCRDGYQCQAVGGVGQGWCAPGSNTPSNFQGDMPFSIECQSAFNNTVDLDFSIADTTTSYMIVPVTSNGNWLNPRYISLPGGGQVNFSGDNDFQAAGAQLFGVINPTIVPAAPQFQTQLRSGSHTYRLTTADSEICYYMIESSGIPTTIDLNIYILGLDDINLTASNAETHPHLQDMLSEVDSLFQQSGISLGQIRYQSVSPNVEEEYRIIRNQGDVGRLAAYSAYPNDTVDGALSANIYLVEQFAFSGGGGVLGISQGIPGAAGLHNTSISGVALTGEYIGYSLGQGISGNDFTANVLVHELGHFLGLFHTSETSGQSYDPVNDTPQCTNFNTPWNCPDWNNLMFPMADISNTEITSDQSFVIQVNPLTK